MAPNDKKTRDPGSTQAGDTTRKRRQARRGVGATQAQAARPQEPAPVQESASVQEPAPVEESAPERRSAVTPARERAPEPVAAPAPFLPRTTTGRIPIIDVAPHDRGRRPVPRQGRRRRTVLRRGDGLSRGTRQARRQRRHQRPRRPDPRLGPDALRRARHRPLVRRRTAGRRGRLDVPDRGVERPRRHLAARRPRSRSRPASTSAVMLEEGAQLLERAADNLRVRGLSDDTDDAHDASEHDTRDREAGESLLRAAVKALRDDSRPAEARLHVATAPEVLAVLAAHPLRELVTASAAFPLRVDRERALYGTWYEFFPRSEGAYVDRGRPAPGCRGRSRTAAEPAARRRRDGLRRRLPAAGPPDRPGQPQGSATTRSTPARTTPARRGRSAADGGRARRHPPRPRHVRRLRRVRRPRAASTASRSRSTSRCSPRRTTRGSRSTRSGSPRGPTARSRTPRTRRRSTRTSTR